MFNNRKKEGEGKLYYPNGNYCEANFKNGSTDKGLKIACIGTNIFINRAKAHDIYINFLNFEFFQNCIVIAET